MYQIWPPNLFFVSKVLSAEDERVENAQSNVSHTHTASYYRLSNEPYVDMIATHRYSPPKMGGFTLSYSPPSTACYIHKLYIHNSVLCWTKLHSSRLS